jgi:outer membrane protein TolC
LRRHIHIFWVLIGFGLVGLPCQSEALLEKKSIRLNLEECLIRAVEVSPEITIEKSQLGVATSRYLEARSQKYFPRLEFVNLSSVAPAVDLDGDNIVSLATRNDWSRIGFFNKFELDFIQPLFTFGKIGSTIKAAQFGVLAQEKSILQKKNEIRFRISKLYHSGLLAKQLIAVAEEARKIVGKAEENLIEMLDDPEFSSASESDLFRIRIFKLDVEKMYREITRGKKNTLFTLKVLLGFDDSMDFEISEEYLEPQKYTILSLEDYYGKLNQHRPEIARLNAAVLAQDALAEAHRSAYYPQFFIAGSAQFSFAPIRDDIRNPFLRDPWNHSRVGAVLGISLPLNFSQTKAKVRKQEYESEKMRAQQSAALTAFSLEVEKAYRDLVAVKKALEDAKKTLRLSREWLTTEEITFDLDASNTKDLADAIKQHLSAEAEYYRSIFEYNVAIANLKFVTGTIGKD